MYKDNRIRKGDIIITHSGRVGVFTERVGGDSEWPAWSWKVKVMDGNHWKGLREREVYNPYYGWSEMNILNGHHGNVHRQDEYPK